MSNRRRTQAKLGSDAVSYLSVETQAWIDSEATTKAGDVNVWECKACNWKLPVIHKDTGVTPMFLAHMPEYGGDPLCTGTMVSWGYPPDLASTTPKDSWAFEWYRPTPQEYQKHSEPMKAHLRDGGLALRKIPTA